MVEPLNVIRRRAGPRGEAMFIGIDGTRGPPGPRRVSARNSLPREYSIPGGGEHDVTVPRRQSQPIARRLVDPPRLCPIIATSVLSLGAGNVGEPNANAAEDCAAPAAVPAAKAETHTKSE